MKRLCPLLVLLVAGAAYAGPSKQYSVQQTTRCAYVSGCPRLRANAASHARGWCTEEGGVKRGGRRRDFRCEQRGIYCVVSGRIECNGKLDARSVPGRPDASTSPAPRPSKTCLDLDCSRYVDHAPGRREQGAHACPPGHALVGVAGRGGDIVCRRLGTAPLESRLDEGTQRSEMHACPVGMLARGVSDGHGVLLCTRVDADLGREVSQDETGNLGLQVCDERHGEAYYVTGIDGARSALLCAPLR